MYFKNKTVNNSINTLSSRRFVIQNRYGVKSDQISIEDHILSFKNLDSPICPDFPEELRDPKDGLKP